MLKNACPTYKALGFFPPSLDKKKNQVVVVVVFFFYHKVTDGGHRSYKLG